jgi:hypothetical protein
MATASSDGGHAQCHGNAVTSPSLYFRFPLLRAHGRCPREAFELPLARPSHAAGNPDYFAHLALRSGNT